MPWEKNMCVCSGTSWGWMADDPVSDFDWLIKMMVDVVCRDGNWLVNIGPDRNGHVPEAVVKRMREIGEWLKVNGETIYKTRGGPIEPVDNVYGTTFRDNQIFLHITDLDAFRGIKLPPIEYKIVSVSYKNQTLQFSQDKDGISIEIPDTIEKEADNIIYMATDVPIKTAKQAEIYFTGKG